MSVGRTTSKIYDDMTAANIIMHCKRGHCKKLLPLHGPIMKFCAKTFCNGNLCKNE